MKFKWKIFFLCVGIYVMSLTLAAVIVTEKSYSDALEKEVRRNLAEEDNMHSSANLYLYSVAGRPWEEKININDYSSRLADMFSNQDAIIEIYDTRLKLLSASKINQWPFPREELTNVLSGERSYILRRHEGRHYIFISDVLEMGQQKMPFVYIKELSAIDDQRQAQYRLFAEVGGMGLVLLVIISVWLVSWLLRPIQDLARATQNIATGNYDGRVNISGQDEIAMLGRQFDLMADQVQKHLQELAAEAERKQRFIDNLSHELRTPLTSIIGYADTLNTIKYEEELFHRGLGYIYSEGRRMLRLVNSLMDMILLRETAFELRECNIKPLLEEVAGIMAPRVRQKEVSLILEAEDIILGVDRDLIKGALINLVDNAVNASEPGTPVILGSRIEGEAGVLYVADQGRGMKAEELQRIREPFYRGDKSRSRQEGGIGLGLSICQEIVAGHGARLEIESEVGRGTAVKIIFDFIADVPC